MNATEKTASPQNSTEKMRRTYLPALALVLLLTTILGRGMGYIYSVMATDILYSEVLVSVMGIVVELFSIFRTVLGYVGILYALYRWGSGGKVVITVVFCQLLDICSRYLVDSVTSSITHMERLAMLWLLLQFCYELLLLLVVWGLVRFWIRPANQGTRRTLGRMVTYSVLVLLGTRMALEIYYIVDFFCTYTDVTGAELSAMAGQLLYTAILYGAAAWGIGQGLAIALRQMYGEPAGAGEERLSPKES